MAQSESGSSGAGERDVEGQGDLHDEEVGQGASDSDSAADAALAHERLRVHFQHRAAAVAGSKGPPLSKMPLNWPGAEGEACWEASIAEGSFACATAFAQRAAHQILYCTRPGANKRAPHARSESAQRTDTPPSRHVGKHAAHA